MPILNAKVGDVGQSGQVPVFTYVETNDPSMTVFETGYLNGLVRNGVPLSVEQMALVVTQETPSSPPQVSLANIVHVGANWSLSVYPVPVTGSGWLLTGNNLLSGGSVLGPINLEQFTIVTGNIPIYVFGADQSVTITAAGAGWNLTSTAPVSIAGTQVTIGSTAGNVEIASFNNLNLGASGNVNLEASGNTNIDATGNVNIAPNNASLVNIGGLSNTNVSFYTSNILAGEVNSSQNFLFFYDAYFEANIHVGDDAFIAGFASIVSSDPANYGGAVGNFISLEALTTPPTLAVSGYGLIYLDPTDNNLWFANATGNYQLTPSLPANGNWVDETGAAVTMVSNTGYTSDDGATLVTFTLPTSAVIGDYVEIQGKGSGLWSIAQAAGQQIFFGNTATTAGTGGSLASSLQYDCVKLRALTSGASSTWNVVSSIGNLVVT